MGTLKRNSLLPGFLVVVLLLNYALAQEPSMTVTSTDSLDGVSIGGTFSINCTVTVPEGYMFGYTLFPSVFFSSVSWISGKTGLALTSNTTTIESDLRVSAVYFNSTGSLDHTYELTLANVQSSDSGVYVCNAFVSPSSGGQPTTTLSENLYVSIGDILHDDRPQCYISPGDTTFEDLRIEPTCVLKNADINQTVEWTILYTNGLEENTDPTYTKLTQGSNYKQFSISFGPLYKTVHDGIKFTCSVTLPNGGPAMNCTTGEVSVIAGAKISTENLLGAKVGETATVMAQIEFPTSDFYASRSTWSKIIDSQYRTIVTNDMVEDGRVDPNRFDVQVVESNGVYTSTVTISNLQESDTGYYSSTVVVGTTIANSMITITSYLQFFRITVGYDLYDTIPRCELRSDFDPIPLDEQFRMDCTVKRSNLTINMAWIRITPDGSITNLDSQPTGAGLELINYLTRYVRPNEPYSDYIGSTVVCMVTSPDLPGVANNCSFGPFMGPSTTPLPTTIPPMPSTNMPTTQEPTMTLTTTDVLEGVPSGEAFAINCTLIIPEGFMIGYSNVPFPAFSSVVWRHQRTGLSLALNTTAIESDPRVSVAYFNNTDSLEHTYELTIANVQPSDSSVYVCETYVTSSDPTKSVQLSENVYLSIGDVLYDDQPQCYVSPSDITFEGLSVNPTCVLKNGDINQTVEWTIMYPNGVEEKTDTTSMVQGSNYKQFSIYFGDLDKTTHDGMKFTCSVTLPNGGPAMNCTTSQVNVIEGTMISSENLLGANVGETATVMAQIEFPTSDFMVWRSTWSKIIDDGYNTIVFNDMVEDSRVDPNRFDVQVVESNGVYSSTVTISNLQESDTGYYSSSVHVRATLADISNFYLQFFQDNCWV